jgi:hypothetical protein
MDEQVPCPHCGAFPAERLLSAFAVSTASGAGDRDPACAYGAPQPAACGACGDPRGPGACSL